MASAREAAKSKIGWSSIAFGALPVTLCGRSQKTTPTILVRADPHLVARLRNLLLAVGGGVDRAERRVRRLGDHVGGAVLEHHMRVLVVLLEHVRDRGLDRVDVALEVAASLRRRLGPFEAGEPRDCPWLCRVELRSVLQRLDAPALGAANEGA
jgi:hypothetical protein